MSDMLQTIVPKSDQLNADDLIGKDLTIKITRVEIKSGEQPISIYFDGDEGKPYKCCKSMARVMVSAWGADSKKYVGRMMTLYRDPKVKWAGMEVGGIRISHMSDIGEDMTMALTVTRSNKKPFTVRPLDPATINAPPTAAPAPSPQASGGASSTITDDDESALLDHLESAGVTIAAFCKQAKIKTIRELQKARLAGATQWVKEQKGGAS